MAVYQPKVMTMRCVLRSKRARGLALLGSLLVLAACAATSTGLGKRELDVQTRMTDSIFLDPVPRARRTVFVQVRNTSDRPDFEIADEIRRSIESRGYRIVEDPGRAHYLLQANVLQVGRTSPTAAEQTFGGGFGSAIFGGAIGAIGTRAATKDTGAIIAGGLAGAAVSSIADSLVEDVTYSITTDIQISERTREGVVVTETTEQTLGQGTSGQTVIKATETHDWKRYQTRIMSTANKANLEFEEAAPRLVGGLTRSIAGIF